MEDVTDADYKHAKRLCKYFERKKLRDYHDLYVQNETFLLVDVYENFRDMRLKIYELNPAQFLTAPELTMQAVLIKNKGKFDLKIGINMLLMVGKGIRGGICHDIHRYAKANNKYMKDYDKNEKSLYLNYCELNNLYDWAMSQKLPVNDFKRVEETYKFNEDFIISYNADRDEGYFLEVDVKYPENLHNLHNDLPFFPERMKIEKLEKLVANLQDKEEYVIETINLKQALNNGLVLREVHRVIKFNQKSLVKTISFCEHRSKKKAINDFEKDFSKLMNNAVFGKTMKNVRKHRNTKLVTTETRRNY